MMDITKPSGLALFGSGVFKRQVPLGDVAVMLVFPISAEFTFALNAFGKAYARGADIYH